MQLLIHAVIKVKNVNKRDPGQDNGLWDEIT